MLRLRERFLVYHWVSSRCFCTRASLGNTYLKPVLRKIHPDLFVSEGDEIQQANLKCIQTLRELWHSLDDLIPQVFGTSSGQSSGVSIMIKAPLKAKYDIVCFMKPTPIKRDDEDASNDTTEEIPNLPLPLLPIRLQLTTPSSLCQTHLLNHSTARSALVTFLHQQANLWNQLHLDIPWRELIPDYDQSNLEDDFTTPTASSPFMQAINTTLFDRAVTRHHKHRPFANSLFDDETPVYRKHGKNWDHKRRKTAQLVAVNKYIESGHIRLKHVAITEEVEVMEKMRQFFMDYGEVMNFGGHGWEKVLFLVENHVNRFTTAHTTSTTAPSTTTSSTEKQTAESAEESTEEMQMRSSKESATSSESTADTAERVKEQQHKASADSTGKKQQQQKKHQKDYSLIQKDGYWICIIPMHFKAGHLVPFLQQSLPCAQLLQL